MILEADNLLINEIEKGDSEVILEIYNSNKDFLLSHLDKKQVKLDWLTKEIESMKKSNFKTYKIKEKSSNRIIGFIDLKLSEESYLSLMMIHRDYKNLGYGKKAYDLLEDYFRRENVKNIRVDVVYDYDDTVMKFWQNRGFDKIKNIKLRWEDQFLGAALMRKAL